MSVRKCMWVLLPALGASCATSGIGEIQLRASQRGLEPQKQEPQEQEPQGQEPQGQEPQEQAPEPSDQGDVGDDAFEIKQRPRRIKKPTRRAGTQPGRLRHAQTLAAESWTAQFRIEENSGDATILPGATGGFFSTAYGVTDNFMVQAQISDGHQFETVSVAETPGRVFDAGAQYRFVDSERLTVAGRVDVVLADTSAFEPTRDSSKVSFQPGVLANYDICDGLDFYTSTSLRLSDGVEPALALGFGLLAPVGRVNFFLEADAIAQKIDGGKDILESYLTPGIQFVLRDKIDINVAPSIGLSSTSYDWRFAVTMGVHF